MSQIKRGLGRGLGDLGVDELLSDITTTPEVANSDNNASEAGRLCYLPLDALFPGRYQPRQNIDEESLSELAESIRAEGIIQPIVVRPADNGYEIIAGERRWRASQLAGLSTIPAIVRVIPDRSAVAMSLIENIQRRDLNAIEEAQALQRLISEFQMTHQEVADAVGKSRAATSNLLRLLNLNPDVRNLVEQGLLDMGHARALLALEGVEQSEVADEIVSKMLSVRETEKLIRRHKQGHDSENTEITPRKIDPNIRALQERLSDTFSAKVRIQHQQSGQGKLVIHYNSVDELDGILEHIHITDE